MSTESPRRILVVSLDNLGDLVFASALVPPLARAFPAATIDVWCKRYTEDVAALIPHVNSVIAADPFWAAPRGVPRPSVGAFLQSIREVRGRHHDVAVLSEAPWRVAAAVAAARVPMRIGLARHRNGVFLTHALERQDDRKPVLREQARLLSALGVESPEPRYRLDVKRLGIVWERVAALLPPRFAALHPFAGARDRCVPLAEWTQVALALDASGIPVLWIGTGAELTELRRYTHPKGYYADQIADGSLASSAAALSLATFFVGHDSGPLHVAGAFGVPVVGVFAPGQPQRTFPQGVGRSRMLRAASPTEISAATLLREIDVLLSSAT